MFLGKTPWCFNIDIYKVTIKHDRVFLVPCKKITSPVYATVHVYTGQATLYKVPETQLCLTGQWSLCSSRYDSTDSGRSAVNSTLRKVSVTDQLFSRLVADMSGTHINISP